MHPPLRHNTHAYCVSTDASKVQAAYKRVTFAYVKLPGHLRANVRILTFWTRV